MSAGAALRTALTGAGAAAAGAADTAQGAGGGGGGGRAEGVGLNKSLPESNLSVGMLFRIYKNNSFCGTTERLRRGVES